MMYHTSNRLQSLLFTLFVFNAAFGSAQAPKESDSLTSLLSTDPVPTSTDLSSVIESSSPASNTDPEPTSSLIEPSSISPSLSESSASESNSPSAPPTDSIPISSSIATSSVEPSSEIPEPSSSAQPPPPEASDVPSGEFDTIVDRRIPRILGSTNGSGNVKKWLESQRADGTWEDVNYARGCPAQRANWPAQQHWVRAQALAATWRGGFKGFLDEFQGSEEVFAAVNAAMDWWFDRDFTNEDCLYDGGKDACPCDDSDEHMWNTNWYANVIGIPIYIGKVCLLIGKENLTPSQLEKCTSMPSRSYASISELTGANVLDVASIGIDMALLTTNETVLVDAYTRVHNEMRIIDVEGADGTRPDGSFGQHIGLMYNGNYGKDFVNAILNLETQAAGTELAASNDVQEAFEVLIDGDKWVVYQNTITGTPHWDFSVLPRFITFPVVDNQATANLKMNLSQVKELGAQWKSDTIQSFANTIEPPTNSESANVNGVTGNRMFFTQDYMVHRSNKYISTLKMLSKRTATSECTNTQNPYGFHLSDGTLYTYVEGDEYEDISASWDWNIIPGTTTFYNSTILDCTKTKSNGTEAFVGGISNEAGEIGVSAMRYGNPLVKGEGWQKAWFFLPNDVQRVFVSAIKSPNNSTNHTVLSVLDQKKHKGVVYVEDEAWDDVQSLHENGTTTYELPKSLWHAGVGYTFDEDQDISLQIELGEKTGDWSKIGTSKEPPYTVDLFAASIVHNTLEGSFAYTAYPGTDSLEDFQAKEKAGGVETVQNDEHVSAVYDWADGKAMMVFWDKEGGEVKCSVGMIISTNAASVLIFDTVTGELTVSDPTQLLDTLEVTMKMGEMDKIISFELPRGGLAGKAVTKNAFSD